MTCRMPAASAHASSTATGETNAKIANLQTNRPIMTDLLDTPCAAEGGRVRPIRTSKGPSSRILSPIEIGHYYEPLGSLARYFASISAKRPQFGQFPTLQHPYVFKNPRISGGFSRNDWSAGRFHYYATEGWLRICASVFDGCKGHKT